MAGLMDAFEAGLLAQRAHRGQLDKNDRLYFEHAFAVAEAVNDATDGDNDHVVVAYLHDVIEDTSAELRRGRRLQWVIEFQGYSYELTEAQGDALYAITRQSYPVEEYAGYIRRLAANPIARVVKIFDLKHNLSPERRYEGDEGIRERRYLPALDYLEGGDDGGK